MPSCPFILYAPRTPTASESQCSHATRRHWTNVSCTVVCTCKCTLSSPRRTRPTKLIDGSLACPIPLSLVASAKHVSSHTPAAPQDTISRRLRAGREQHKVETVAWAVRGRWVAPSSNSRNASPATHLRAIEGVRRHGSGCQRDKCQGPRLGRAC